MRTRRLMLIAMAAGLGPVVAAQAAAAAGPQPIGPKQHFVGLVNGRNVGAVVYTACPGPIWPGRSTQPVGGQTFSVLQVQDGGGYTASSSTVWANFDSDRRQFDRFTSYGEAQAVPKSKVPCEGSGTVTFSPCFGTMPCPVGAQDNVVKVQFVNIAD